MRSSMRPPFLFCKHALRFPFPPPVPQSHTGPLRKTSPNGKSSSTFKNSHQNSVSHSHRDSCAITATARWQPGPCCQPRNRRDLSTPIHSSRRNSVTRMKTRRQNRLGSPFLGTLCACGLSGWQSVSRNFLKLASSCRNFASQSSFL